MSSIQRVDCNSDAAGVTEDEIGMSNPAFVADNEISLANSAVELEKRTTTFSDNVIVNSDNTSSKTPDPFVLRSRNGTEEPQPDNSTVNDAPNENADNKQSTARVELKKELGLWNGVGIIVGIMIGSGIFVSPGTVLKYSGSIGMSLVIWALTGVMSLVGALCFAELGTMILTSGGEYTYIYEAFGSIPAFLSMWIQIFLQRPGGRAINAITFATYLLQPFLSDCEKPPSLSVRLIAASMLCIATYINCVNVKMGTRVQNVFALMKILALVLIIAIGICHISNGHFENFQDPWQGTSTDPTLTATAFYSTIFAYSGWNSLNVLTEELVDPYRNLPRAIAISLLTIIVVYILANAAYFAVLTPNEILSSSAVAVTFGSRTLGVLGWVISICVACSTFGNTNGNIIVQSRMMFVGARQGHLPRFMSLIQVNNNTPIMAVISVLVIPLLMILAPDIGSLLAYTSFTKNLVHLTCVLALLWLRYKEPHRNRPIKVWLGFPILFLLLTIFVAVFPVIQKPVEIGVAVGLFFFGLVIYYLTIHLKTKFINEAMDKVTYLCQMIFLCVEEDKFDQKLG